MIKQSHFEYFCLYALTLLVYIYLETMAETVIPIKIRDYKAGRCIILSQTGLVILVVILKTGVPVNCLEIYDNFSLV